jgi:phage nucleotide-binding protein
MKFTTTSKAAKLNGIKVLVYGEAGMGKTVLASTAPSPLIISAESGLLSLANKDIPVVEIKTVDDLTEAYEWCLKSKHASKFETICIDSITEIGEVVLANAKSQVKDARQAYGELIEKINTTVKAFRDLRGFNVYMTSKEELYKDEEIGKIKYRPMMPGSKLSPQLPYLFDEVFCLRIGSTKDKKEFRYLQTQPDIRYTAKDRSGVLDAMEKPNLTHIFNKILKGVN